MTKKSFCAFSLSFLLILKLVNVSKCQENATDESFTSTALISTTLETPAKRVLEIGKLSESFLIIFNG